MIEIIVIGDDHQNTLGVIRALGKEGLTVNLIIYNGSKDKIKCKKSKYCRGFCWNRKLTDNELLDSLMKLFTERKIKYIIIPTSDWAAAFVDKNYNILSIYCALPSINRKQNEICTNMNKYNQKQLAEKYGVLMAKTEIIDITELKIGKLTDMESLYDFPCVLKPVVSTEGVKADIRMVYSKREFCESIKEFQMKNYNKILVQEFINKDYELCVFGCLTQNSNKIYYGILKKIRYYPFTGGASLSFAQFTGSNDEIIKIVNILKKINYTGLFDIEIFVKDGKYYLNEINFRNSGNTWALVNRGINAPYIWVQDIMEEKISDEQKQIIDDYSYFMNETADFRHVLCFKISLVKWLRDVLKTKSFNKFWEKDLRGSITWYIK